MREIAIFKPQFSKREKDQIKNLSETLWDVLEGNSEPLIIDTVVMTKKRERKVEPRPCFIIKSIKVEKTDDGEVTVYDTSTEPYAPIYNRYILQLLIDNLLEEV